METKKILVINKSETFTLLLSELSITHEIMSASSGREGLRIFRENPFDLIIVASDLPMSWRTIVQKIRKLDSKIKVLLMADDVEYTTLKQALFLPGVNAILNKENVVVTLNNKISEALV